MMKPGLLNLPKHVAVIMDGNGRWAQELNLDRAEGHREGARRVDDLISACIDFEISYLTLFTFSTENWKRPLKEISTLMNLLLEKLYRQGKDLHEKKVRLLAKGALDQLPWLVRQELNKTIVHTNFENPALTLTLCLSYGGRQEIVDATKNILAAVRRDPSLEDRLDEALFSNYLYQTEVPDPDLVIRTGNEKRISNFLLWQIAYSEVIFCPVLWPDFKRTVFEECLNEFSSRVRRFGKTTEQVLAERKTEPATSDLV